ncbi:MAG: transcription factor FapR [Desulfitobacteriaceae bacterium]|nr:transcription factor FapR [Desulfitobacteriaceae bacterium]MDD4346319.1 transcription factor FapR [Desulfitobacteriaceae bacterium]
MSRFPRQERREALREIVLSDPFFTDQELAKRFGVSIPTIRYDRRILGIPELRERTRVFAREAYGTLRSSAKHEVIGELKELVVGVYACSELKIDETIVLPQTKAAQSHYLFAQANSLALALTEAKAMCPGKVELEFIRPVFLGECVEAIGRINEQEDNKYRVRIISTVCRKEVLRCEWILFTIDSPIRGEGEGNY